MKIAQLTDLHVSKYGIRMTQFRKIGRDRAARDKGWRTVWKSDGWRIDIRHAERRLRFYDALRLVDDDGYIHEIIKVKNGGTVDAVLKKLHHRRVIHSRTCHAYLAKHCPTDKTIEYLLKEDPNNENIQFCAVAKTLMKDKPDWIIITGDVTDDGVGYDLVQAGFQQYIKKKRLVCIPGNHDIYATSPVFKEKPLRRSVRQKRKDWEVFADSLGIPKQGGYVLDLGSEVVLACFDTCQPSHVPGSASGLLPLHQIHAVEMQLKERKNHTVRLACMHHPIINMQYHGLNFPLFQPGMRLRNAKRVYPLMAKMGFSLVMYGHQHAGYIFQPAEGPVFMSAPSSTYGCRSGASPFYWSVEVDRKGIHKMTQKRIGLLERMYK
ncbi:metallophosphoesterase [bacterium]|nr:metallophosphoesterase [bacterium]